MARRTANPDFLNGVPELLILELLSRRPMYGYELVEAIRVATGEALSFGEGCVYPILHRLEEQGCLTSSRQQVGGRSRVIYRVTKDGGARLCSAVAQWRSVALAVQRALTGGEHGPAIFAR